MMEAARRTPQAAQTYEAICTLAEYYPRLTDPRSNVFILHVCILLVTSPSYCCPNVWHDQVGVIRDD